VNFQVASIDDLFRNWHFLQAQGVEIEMGPGRHPQSTAIFLYFLGPEGFTYEYSFGVRRIEDEAAWVPRSFDPDEPGSIDMWMGPTKRVSSQSQLTSGAPADGASPVPEPGGAGLAPEPGGAGLAPEPGGAGLASEPGVAARHLPETVRGGVS
jgi:hypothetical protein